MLKFVVKELDRTLREIKAEEDRTRKAAEAAAKIEGFRLMGTLKNDLRSGRAGGSAFADLREISRRLGKPMNRRPLAALAKAVRYNAARSGDAYHVEVGFTDTRKGALSKSWKKIAQRLQEGVTTPVRPELRSLLIEMGTRLKGRRTRWTKAGRSGGFIGSGGPDDAARFFFIRKQTTQFRTPARPIIEPFWAAHREEAEKNIVENWERKMRGERI